ncbi:MAG: hypothetical protein KatS3mg111_2684 [Pirellulaceae bacterium]|nr:MAG: hypothetical protein KatS3mg111_2684 [Pirellulaceae bacterium]
MPDRNRADLHASTSSSSSQRTSSSFESHSRWQRIEKLAHWLDHSIAVPGTNLKFGWDSIIGLVPGIGDVVTSALSLWILAEAPRLGASRWLILRMLFNIAVDSLTGSIPIAGDLFDAAFKSNRRNLELLRRHLQKRDGMPSK